jgi:hypothetical protein
MPWPEKPAQTIAERIVHGEDRSIDLSRLSYSRVLENRPYRERGIL